jgi:recombination protein RecT
MSETALARPKDLFTYFESKMFRDKLLAAIPNHIKPERMIQLALTMIKGSTSLMKCSPISLMACVLESAQLGLELDRILGHAYIVPFKGEATLIIGYRGFAHLMYQTGVVSAISAEIVRPKDKFFRTLGTNRGLHHEPAKIPEQDDPDFWVGAYAVAHMLTGTTEFEYMERSKIESSRNRSRSYQAWLREKKDSPWITDTEEMWRKTPVRRLAKRMPVSTTDKRDTLLRAVMLDEYGERKGLLVPTESGFQMLPEPEREAPIEPTTELEQQLQESIDIVDAGKKGGKPPREPKKAPKPPTPKQQPAQSVAGPQRANIPSGAVPLNESKLGDSFLTTKQQTDIFNAAFQLGWKVPEELNRMLLKHYNAKSVRDLRNSQFADVMQKVKSGT